VDLNASEETGDVGDDAGQKAHTPLVQEMSQAMELTGVEARVAKDDL
jgi:hypothetical protein